MANWDTPSDCVNDALFRADEPVDGTSDFLAAVRRAAVRANHDVHNRYPFWWARKYPPGAFVTSDDITSLTITVASTGTSVAGTLSAIYATSLANFKLLPTGKDWYARITAHTAGTNAVTLDAVPDTLAAGSAITIVQDEYQLASDLGLFVDGLWTNDGDYIAFKSEEQIRKEYGDKPEPAWPPSAFCRLDQRRIRLSHYPTSIERVEYPYCTMPDDIDPTDGATELTISHNFRYLLADGALYFAYLMKSDKRVAAAKKDYEDGIEQAISYHRRLMMGIGSNPGSAPRAPYQ